MAERFQYPIQAAIDPETLDDPLRDEIQWFQAFSFPVWPTPSVAEIPSFFIDPEALGAVEAVVVTLDEYQPLSGPVLPEHQIRPGIIVIDPETLSDPLRDEIQWFQEFSIPVLPEHQTRPGIGVIDTETLGDSLRDEIQWFTEFSVPVLPEEQTRLGWFVIDTETLGDALRDEVQWFQQFSFPVWPKHQVRPGWFVIDSETLAEGLRDELQWFQPLSEPIRDVARLIEAGNIFVDEPPAVIVDDDLDWFRALSDPELLPPWRHLEAFMIDPEALGEAATVAAIANRHTIHRGSGVAFSDGVSEDFRIGKEDVSQES